MSQPLAGTLVLPDGRTIEWSVTPGIDIVYWAAGTQALRLPCRADSNLAEAALIGWHEGEAAGRQTGRAMLQQEFRSLMSLAQ